MCTNHVFISECNQEFARVAVKHGSCSIPVIFELEATNKLLEFCRKLQQVSTSIVLITAPNHILEFGPPVLKKKKKVQIIF